MVYFDTLEEWQKQTSLLLQARPATARITTKYNIPNLEAPRYKVTNKRKRDTDVEDGQAAATPRAPRGTFTVKTYDSQTGTTLKFKTDKSADVGRMITGLGRAGRIMAALPEKTEAPDTVMEDVAPISKDEAAKDGSATTIPDTKAGAAAKKKKKGKK